MSEPIVMRRNRQREQLILALLQQPGLEKAAAAVGISTVTAWRITKTPEFKEEYRQARREGSQRRHNASSSLRRQQMRRARTCAGQADRLWPFDTCFPAEPE